MFELDAIGHRNAVKLNRFAQLLAYFMKDLCQATTRKRGGLDIFKGSGLGHFSRFELGYY